MLVVLEGCDGTGKTTLATRLAKVLNGEIIHCNTKTPNDYSFFEALILASKDKNIIADRFCYGQFVYQEEADRKLTKEQLYELEVLMLRENAKVIWVDAKLETIEERLDSREEKLINGLTPAQVCDRYSELFGDSILPVQRWVTD